jgi:transcriptional regulator GlxA family with amidase domain
VDAGPRGSAGSPQFKTHLMAKVASQDRLRDVQLWIAEHPEANLSVRALASRAGMSARHFSRAFAVETGLPPGRYVDRARIEAARRCLEDTTRRIEEVCDEHREPGGVPAFSCHPTSLLR